MNSIENALETIKKNPVIILGVAGVGVLIFMVTKGGQKAPAIDNTPVTYQIMPSSGGGGGVSAPTLPLPIPTPIYNPNFRDPNPEPNRPNWGPINPLKGGPTGPYECIPGYHWNGTTCVPDSAPVQNPVYADAPADPFKGVWDSMRINA